MYRRLLLVSALLSVRTRSGESTVNNIPQNLHAPVKIQALVGSFAVLPCAFNITTSPDFPTTVEWSKQGLKEEIVFLYRDGCETHEIKEPAFEYRTSFITKLLKNGNISLRIADVRLSDAGTYLCKKLWTDLPPDITTVELDVVSDPRLSVVSGESPGVTVQCEVSSWLPEPEIVFLDDRGNELPTEEEARREKEDHGCYMVKRRLALQTATNSVTCRVQEPQSNQSREPELAMPVSVESLESSILTWKIATAVGWSLFFILACAVYGKWLWKRYCKPEKEHKHVTRQLFSASTDALMSEENQSLLQQKKSFAVKVDQLTKENARLKSDLHELQKRRKSPVVCQLDQPTMNSSTLSGSKHPKSNQPKNKCRKSALQRQNSNPGPSRPIQRTFRNASSPDLCSCIPAALSSPSSLSIAESKRHRSMSDGFSQPTTRRPQTRPSVQSQVLSNNPYGPLAKLNEDSVMY